MAGEFVFLFRSTPNSHIMSCYNLLPKLGIKFSKTASSPKLHFCHIWFFATLLLHLHLISPQSSQCDQLIVRMRARGKRGKENEFARRRHFLWKFRLLCFRCSAKLPLHQLCHKLYESQVNCNSFIHE